MADAQDSLGICDKCHDAIVGGSSGCSAMGKIYHVTCFCCAACEQQLRGRQFYAVNELPYCEEDYLETLDKCAVCAKPICERILSANSNSYHPECFRCTVCDVVLDNVPFTLSPDGQVHCIRDYHEKFAPRCSVCKLPIVAESSERETIRIVALERNFHVACYKCEDCEVQLASSREDSNESIGCYPLDGHILCRDCNRKRQQPVSRAAGASASDEQ